MPAKAASIAFCTALAVTKSGLRRTMDTTLLSRYWDTTSFSTMAPCGDGADRLRAVRVLRGHHPSLCHRIGLPVGRLEIRLEEDAAVQVTGITDAGDRHVDSVPCPGEWRQLRAHHDHGRILAADVLGRHGHPEARHEGGKRGAQQRRRGRVALAVEAGHESQAEDLVAAHAAQGGDVLDSHGGHGEGRSRDHEQEQRGEPTEGQPPPPFRR